MIRKLMLVALIAIAGACSSAAQAGEQVVVLDEFSVTAAGELAAGETGLVVRNDGEFGHTLVVTDDRGDVVLVTDLIEPGEGEAVRAELDPGRYQFSCRIVVETPDGSISDHYEQGMVQDVVVTGN